MYDGTIIERLIAAVERAEQENARITEAEKILETAAKYQEEQ